MTDRRITKHDRQRMPAMPARRARRAAAMLACVLGLTVAACGSDDGTGAGGDTPPSECREEWASHLQTMGENGNPAAPGTPLARRYDLFAAEAARLAESATAQDCPKRLNDAVRRLDVLYQLEFEVRTHDMRQQLAAAEMLLEHSSGSPDHVPEGRLGRAFATLRGSAERAHHDLAPALAASATVELTNPALKQATSDLATAASRSQAYQRCSDALAVIGEFELDEE